MEKMHAVWLRKSTVALLAPLGTYPAKVGSLKSRDDMQRSVRILGEGDAGCEGKAGDGELGGGAGTINVMELDSSIPFRVGT